MNDPATPKRKLETVLCTLLKPRVPNLTFFPVDGTTGEDGNEIEPDGPYAVVAVKDEQLVIEDEGVYNMDTRVVVVTSIGEETPEEHSSLVRATQDALKDIRANGFPWRFPDQQFALLGLDVMPGARDVPDDRNLGRASVLILAVGCQG